MGRAGGGDGGCGEGQKPVISTFRGNESVHTSISLISEINEWAINHVSFWDEFVLLAYEYELLRFIVSVTSALHYGNFYVP